MVSIGDLAHASNGIVYLSEMFDLTSLKLLIMPRDMRSDVCLTQLTFILTSQCNGSITGMSMFENTD